MNPKTFIKKITDADYPLLEDFLYHAIFLPPGTDPLPREVIKKPELFIYIDNFGGKDDCGLVAELDDSANRGKIVGATWTRIIPAFGHVDDETPELAISVLPEYRGKGIGTRLLKKLFELLAERGYKQTSLSVQKENPALRLYLRLGYKTVKENAEDFIMVKDLSSEAQAFGISLGLCFGVAIGVSIGTMTNNIGLWIPVGISIGLCLGSVWPMLNKKRKKKD